MIDLGPGILQEPGLNAGEREALGIWMRSPELLCLLGIPCLFLWRRQAACPPGVFLQGRRWRWMVSLHSRGHDDSAAVL